MSSIRRSVKLTKKIFADWVVFFHNEIINSTSCPDFEEHMKAFVSEMMTYTNLNDVYSYTE
jgi:hypothetical protein